MDATRHPPSVIRGSCPSGHARSRSSRPRDGSSCMALGAGMTFFSDEWAFIAARSLANPIDWLRPHNEHWSTLPIILYRLLVETVGIGSYLPYLAVVACAARRRCVPRLPAGSPAQRTGSGVPRGPAGPVLRCRVREPVLGVPDGVHGIDAHRPRGDGRHRPRPTKRRAAAVVALLLVSLASSGHGADRQRGDRGRVAGSTAAGAGTSRGWQSQRPPTSPGTSPSAGRASPPCGTRSPLDALAGRPVLRDRRHSGTLAVRSPASGTRGRSHRGGARDRRGRPSGPPGGPLPPRTLGALVRESFPSTR